MVAANGWYPDPGGVPGRYRYWNGTSWSTETSDDPADPPPTGGRPVRPRRDRDRGAGTGFGVATLVLVIVVISAVVIIERADDASSVGPRSDAGAPVTTASGWDDSEPRTRSDEKSEQSEERSGEDVECPRGQPADLAPHPADGRLHGGRLSMMQVPGYSAPDVEYMLSWMSDTQGTEQRTEPGWQSVFAVGEVARTAGFNTTREAAHASMACAIESSWYLNFGGRKDIRDEPIVIDGHQGWILTAEILEDNPEINVDGDQLTFVAVDDGRSGVWSMWCGMVPLGDRKRIALNQEVLASLEVRS